DKCWERALEEAEDLANYDQPLHIIGSDINEKMIRVSKDNALEAGLTDLITWKQMQVKDLIIKSENGYLVCNPPYGERISNEDQIKQIYQELGAVMKKYPTWSVYVLTAFEAFEKAYGNKSTKKRKL